MTEQILDAVGLSARVRGNRAFLATIASAFWGEYDGKIAALEAAADGGDWPRVGTIAHALKGTLATLGGDRCAATAARIVVASGTSPVDGLIRQFHADVAEYRTALDHFLAEASAL